MNDDLISRAAVIESIRECAEAAHSNYECGMQFIQEIIIVRGREPIVNEKQYENWNWDCPFPNMGG